MITVFLCIIVADFLTGFIHWWEDSYGTPDWPWIGREVIEPNILHHEHPNWIGTMSSLIGRNYQTVVPAAIVAALAALWLGWAAWPVALTLLLASLGNEVHTWNHRHNNNAAIRFLQDAGLIQSRVQHGKHHKPPYESYYCTLTNFTNAVLEAVNFWRALEWAIAAVTGIKTRRCSAERRGF